VYICFWGGDIYRKYDENKKEDVYLKYFIKRAKGIISLTQGDYEIIKEKYDVEGKYFAGQYPEKEKIQKFINTKKQNSIKNILLGNSVTETNCHFEMLEKLSKYKEEDFKLIVPLSYGNKEYAERVKDYGKSIFKESFISLDDFMEPEEYGRILSTIDIGIFYNNRQQAMGNINSLLSMNTKIYLRPGTTMWYRYKDEINCTIYNADDIGNITFDDFIYCEKEELERNCKVYVEYFDEKNLKKSGI